MAVLYPSQFQQSMSTLKETSKDKAKQPVAYMTNSDIPVFDFDKIKNWYTHNFLKGVKPTPASNDALFVSEDRKNIIFIEFKNGQISSTVNNEIFRKNYDSLLLLLDHRLEFDQVVNNFTGDISFTREHIEYILVYNQEVYDKYGRTKQDKLGEQRQQAKNQPQASACRDKLYKTFRALGHQELIKFGLDRFENYLFKKVHTYNKEEFNSKISILFK